MRFGGLVSVCALVILGACGAPLERAETPVSTKAGAPRAGVFSPSARSEPAATVLDGRFNIAGPRGYCVDPAASRETAKGAFVMMGHCRALDEKGPKARHAAVITISIAPNAGQVDAAALDSLGRFVTTKAGSATLRRSYGAGEVTVLDMDRDGPVLMLHAQDGGTQEVSAEYWRAIFGIKDALVTVTTSGLKEAPIDAKTGRALADETLRRLIKVNEDAAAPSSSKATAEEQGPKRTEATQPNNPIKAWLNRLL